jgi:Tfp pilus assembly protein PilF
VTDFTSVFFRDGLLRHTSKAQFSGQSSSRYGFKKFHWLQIGIAFILLMVFSGCASKEELIARHMEKAQQYIAGKEYKSAIIEFKNVVQLDPKNDKAYFEMAETYMKMTEIELAARTYAEAIKSNQNNIKAHLKLGQILLLAQKPLGARKAAKAVLEKEPKNIEAFELMAAVQMQEKNLS